ncbi:GNAT family N-acetyltransferase [Mesorhizobium xinjiangense]|uniref:GNAT family N-acetyltransferase n=1 Tax=Mesorhizobium xinjiangense TaxID=2678685 RepID=UPI0012EE9487|nr:GNAT family N-acetyltransferase [Mesorhizobium xinjiangense]
MSTLPARKDMHPSPAAPMIARLGGLEREEAVATRVSLGDGKPPARELAIYPASAGFDLVDELDHLCSRSVQPNIFFNPRFLAPAMPRLEDRQVQLAVMREETGERSRLRLLLPFSIEREIPLGAPVIRAWSSPFSPLGVPLIDHDDPIGVVEDFFAMLALPRLKLPRVLMLPELPLDGEAAGALRTAAHGRNLPLSAISNGERAVLHSDLDGEAYLKGALRSHHYREFRRLKRRLAEKGELTHDVVRHPEEVRQAAEEFLSLEASGWKGRAGSAMIVDRFQAAFAREAIDRLSGRDMCRIHRLRLDGCMIASLIVFVEQGVAYTWKTAFDEAYGAFSPGTLLMIEATKVHLDDPDIVVSDSCAVPGHPVMSRLWSERREMGTLIVGLTPDSGKAVRQAAGQLRLSGETRNLARQMRSRFEKLVRRR